MKNSICGYCKLGLITLTGLSVVMLIILNSTL